MLKPRDYAFLRLRRRQYYDYMEGRHEGVRGSERMEAGWYTWQQSGDDPADHVDIQRYIREAP